MRGHQLGSIPYETPSTLRIALMFTGQNNKGNEVFAANPLLVQGGIVGSGSGFFKYFATSELKADFALFLLEILASAPS